MARKMIGVFTAVAAALLLVGMAWAGTDGAGEEMSATDATIATVPDQQVTTPTAAEDGTVNEIGGTTSTSTHGEDDDTTSTSIHEEDEDDDTTSTSIHEEDEDDDTTSTSTPDEDDDTTSTSTPDEDDEDDEDESYSIFEDQLVVYDIPGVGSVTVEIVAGRLELVNVSAPGWDVEVKTAEADEVEVKFRKGSDEIEFEAEIKHGKTKIQIEIESS